MIRGFRQSKQRQQRSREDRPPAPLPAPPAAVRMGEIDAAIVMKMASGATLQQILDLIAVMMVMFDLGDAFDKKIALRLKSAVIFLKAVAALPEDHVIGEFADHFTTHGAGYAQLVKSAHLISRGLSEAPIASPPVPPAQDDDEIEHLTLIFVAACGFFKINPGNGIALVTALADGIDPESRAALKTILAQIVFTGARIFTPKGKLVDAKAIRRAAKIELLKQSIPQIVKEVRGLFAAADEASASSEKCAYHIVLGPDGKPMEKPPS